MMSEATELGNEWADCRFSSGPERETVYPIDIKIDRWTGTP
jgi:hypothetical protein